MALLLEDNNFLWKTNDLRNQILATLTRYTVPQNWIFNPLRLNVNIYV